MISSSSPFGALSESISVTKPYLYLPVASFNVSIVCWVAAIWRFLFVCFYADCCGAIVGHLWSVAIYPATGISAAGLVKSSSVTSIRASANSKIYMIPVIAHATAVACRAGAGVRPQCSR